MWRLIFSSGQNLWSTKLTGGSPTRLITSTPGARGPITAAVWSAAGDLAFVRGGAVWLTRHGHAARDLGAGSAPAFSPDARRLAVVRRGWIWAINLASSKSVRIALARRTNERPVESGRQVAEREAAVVADGRGEEAQHVFGLLSLRRD